MATELPPAVAEALNILETATTLFAVNGEDMHQWGYPPLTTIRKAVESAIHAALEAARAEGEEPGQVGAPPASG